MSHKAAGRFDDRHAVKLQVSAIVNPTQYVVAARRAVIAAQCYAIGASAVIARSASRHGIQIPCIAVQDTAAALHHPNQSVKGTPVADEAQQLMPPIH